jgi:hypothetical protein
MNKNQIRLQLDGTVPLRLFSQAMQDFTDFVYALSLELAHEDSIEWTITELGQDRTTIVTTGYAENETSIAKVITAARLVTHALIHDDVILYSQTVVHAAIRLTSVLNGKITALRLTPGEGSEIMIARPIQPLHVPARRVLGTIRGTVETISDHPVTMILIEELFGGAVLCQMSNTEADSLRDFWRERVEVTGMIERDPITGRVLNVTEVLHIDPVHTVEAGFLNTLGTVPWSDGDELPEAQLRRLRNDH